MSRQGANNSMTVSGMKKLLSNAGVTLIGSGGVDENPLAYKDIGAVMRAQRELVNIEGEFMPRIARINEE